MSNNYHFPNNNMSQNQQNGTQLNKDSQIYQPNINYDMQMGNSVDWSAANNSRRLDRNSNVFIPNRPQTGNTAAQNNMNSVRRPVPANMPQPAQPTQQLTAQPTRPPGGAPGPQEQPMQGRMVNPQMRQSLQPQPNSRMPPQYADNSMVASDSMNSSHLGQQLPNPDVEKVCSCIMSLKDPNKKYDSFKLLNEQREHVPQLAQFLWYSTGTVSIMLQEIINIYPNLSPPTLTQSHSERICNVLGLFQCIALHEKTKPLFIKAGLHLYLYPLINKIIKQKPFEHLRVTSLGVIGALVKGEDSETVQHLIGTELIVLCLRIMKKGNLLSRTVATFIVQKILMDESGLRYVSSTEERLLALMQILKDITDELARDPNCMNDKEVQRLLRHIVRCFLRLSENNNATQLIITYFPDCLRNTVNSTITKDDQIRKWISTLLRNLGLN